MRIICHGLTNEDFPVEFTGHRIVLGRAKMNDITIQTTGVAKRHAFLIEDGGELFIQDNKSPNGTFHNYNRIVNREKLSSGDIIHLGICLLLIFQCRIINDIGLLALPIT